MLGRIAGIGRSLAHNAASGLQRFPIPALLIVAFSVASNLEAGSIDGFDRSLLFLTALSLAAMAGLIVALAAEGQGWGRLIGLLLSMLTAGCVGAIVLFVDVSPYQLAGLSSAMMFAVPLAPFVRHGGSDEFWSFGLWAAVGLVIAFLSACVFLVGLYAIVEMVRTLFETDLFENADRYVLVTGLTLVAPLIALGRVPEVSPSPVISGSDDRLAKAIRPLFDWILAPLVWLAALVLHAYIIRTLLLGGLEASEARWLFFVFCSLALMLRIGADPFAPTSATSTRLFHRYWVGVTIAPIATLAVSQWREVDVWGLTPSTYYSALWIATFTGIILIQIVPRARGDIRWMVAIPMTAMIASSFGPWSMIASVERSQTSALRALSVDVWRTGDPGRRAEIRERLAILEDVGGMDAVRSALPAQLVADKHLDGSMSSLPVLFQALGWDSPAEQPTPIRSFRAPQGQAVSLTGYDLALIDLQTGSGEEQTGRGRLELESDGRRLAIHFEGRADHVQTGLLLRRLIELGVSVAEPLVLDLGTENGRGIRLYVTRANYESQPPRLTALTATLLIRADQWHVSPGAEPAR
ncbi:hypothetical protein NS365_00150 [Aureimonas ureilytica]|uniref:DUF4153 domain-containing protein n=1 Tax=Aureimonas ureilytica TaxID=401562 RepID=A0A147DB53_9HYPH|nr:DUF4153 domain-containing protein [Aureimonas ureilytica]KTR08402.1 hypothetical protein NS365_00150 [Aureimonas ureilytica]